MFPASHSKQKCNAKTYPITCKYCGESVYYFSCDCGSGVFFEELGAPWPRHNCHAYSDLHESSAHREARVWLDWSQNQDNTWYQLNRLSKEVIKSLYHNGVYIIWYFDESNFPKIVKVAGGFLGKRIDTDRQDSEVQNYAGHILQVTWASVPSIHLKSVAVYLSQKLQPLVGIYYSGNTPVPVNLPWSIYQGEITMSKTGMKTELGRNEGQLTSARLLLEGAQSALQEEYKHLTEIIKRLESILKSTKRRKNEVEKLIKTHKPPVEYTKEEEFSGDSHRKSEVQGKSLSGPQKFTVKGKRISLSAQQVEKLKKIYEADRKLNPKAGPNGAIKKVLVETGLIPPGHAKNAWGAAARIVGHLTPKQKRKASKNL